MKIYANGKHKMHTESSGSVDGVNYVLYISFETYSTSINFIVFFIFLVVNFFPSTFSSEINSIQADKRFKLLPLIKREFSLDFFLTPADFGSHFLPKTVFSFGTRVQSPTRTRSDPVFGSDVLDFGPDLNDFVPGFRQISKNCGPFRSFVFF